jgi:Ner family transcriptional regulator
MSKNKSPLNMPKKPASTDWHRADIIAAVRKTGTNLQQLSRTHGLGRTTLSNALYGPCPKYERLIAEHLGTTPQIIWPNRYHQDGTPKSGRGERGLGRYKQKADKSTATNNTQAKKSCNVYHINNPGVGVNDKTTRPLNP